jgi:hypothetical protein
MPATGLRALIIDEDKSSVELGGASDHLAPPRATTRIRPLVARFSERRALAAGSEGA